MNGFHVISELYKLLPHELKKELYMGYAVLRMKKTNGMDSAISAHIGWTIKPKNTGEDGTYLDRELISPPDDVTNQTQAIQHHLENVELPRKIEKNQVRVTRILLTGIPKNMRRIEQEGKFGERCDDSLKYLPDTFGKGSIVSTVLHMDEGTPHIHIALMPFVRGERRHKKKEKQVSKRYREKPTDIPRLCADETMTGNKLKSY